MLLAPYPCITICTEKILNKRIGFALIYLQCVSTRKRTHFLSCKYTIAEQSRPHMKCMRKFLHKRMTMDARHSIETKKKKFKWKCEIETRRCAIWNVEMEILSRQIRAMNNAFVTTDTILITQLLNYLCLCFIFDVHILLILFSQRCLSVWLFVLPTQKDVVVVVDENPSGDFPYADSCRTAYTWAHNNNVRCRRVDYCDIIKP